MYNIIYFSKYDTTCLHQLYLEFLCNKICLPVMSQ